MKIVLQWSNDIYLKVIFQNKWKSKEMQENPRAPIMTPNVEERGPRRPKSTFKVKTPQDSSMDESLDFTTSMKFGQTR